MIIMWVANFKLRDDEDIYTPFCKRFNVEFFAYPYTHYIKDGRIHVFAGGILSGSKQSKSKFVLQIRKDPRVMSIEQYHDFIFVHAIHPASREQRAALKVFYNPQFIRLRPVCMKTDGWEYWEVAAIDREELNTLVQAAIKYYHGKLFSIKKEKIRSIASLELAPDLTEKQLEALKLSKQQGYYQYPRKMTLPQLAKMKKKAYSTFQENLSRAENKLVEYFLKYR